jgi:hypothetical protein
MRVRFLSRLRWFSSRSPKGPRYTHNTDTGKQQSNLCAISRAILATALACALSGAAFAQEAPRRDAHSETPASAPDVDSEADGTPVVIDGRTILLVYSSVGGFSPAERAAHIQECILSIGKRCDLSVSLIHRCEPGALQMRSRSMSLIYFRTRILVLLR